jgi:hypothetical protein
MLEVLKVVTDILMVVACLIGPGMVYYGLRQRARARASKAWPHVMGRVVHSEIHMDENGAGVNVEYGYTVEGVAYKGRRLRFIERDLDFAGAQEEHARYHPGAEVPVYFDPAKPSDAALVQDARGSFWWLVFGALGSVFTLVAAIAYVTGNMDLLRSE